MAVSMMQHKKSNAGWQTVKSKTDDKKKREEKKKQEEKKDRLGATIPAPEKNVFAAIDAAWAKKAAEALPRKEDPTPYNGAFAGLTVEQVNLEEPELPPTPPNSDRQAGTASGKTKQDAEPKIKKPKKVKPSVSQVAQGINLTALETSFREWETKYEGNDVSQVEMLGDFFLKTFKECELPFNNILHEKPLQKATEVPLVDIPSGLIEAVQGFLQGKQEDSLKTLLLMLLNATFEGVPEGLRSKTGLPPPKAKVGLLLLLALTIRTRPEALLAASSGMLLLGRTLTAPGRVPQLLWILNQAASVDVSVAVAVWCRVILPQLVSADVLSKKSDKNEDGKISTMDAPAHAPVLDYLESLLSKSVEADVELSSGLAATVPGAAVETVSLSCFSDATSSSAPAQTRSRLQTLFPQLQGIAAASDCPGHFTEWLPLALDSAATSSGSFEGPGDDLVARAAASVVGCLAKNTACHALYVQKHKGLIKGSARVLQRLAASPAMLKPIKNNKDAASSFASMLTQLPARHKFYLQQGRGKGWQGAAARASESAITALQRRASHMSGGGTRSFFLLRPSTWMFSAAAAGAIVLAAHHRQLLVAKINEAAILSPELTTALLQGLDWVDATVMAGVEKVQPHAQPALEKMEQLMQQVSSSQLGQQIQSYIEPAVAQLQASLGMQTKE